MPNNPSKSWEKDNPLAPAAQDTETRRQARAYVQLGLKDDALAMVLPMTRQNPDDAELWWLVTQALDDPIAQWATVRRVLALNPDHAQAQVFHATLSQKAIEGMTLQTSADGEMGGDAAMVWHILENRQLDMKPKPKRDVPHPINATPDDAQVRYDDPPTFRERFGKAILIAAMVVFYLVIFVVFVL